jgi:hypothetical protein
LLKMTPQTSPPMWRVAKPVRLTGKPCPTIWHRSATKPPLKSGRERMASARPRRRARVGSERAGMTEATVVAPPRSAARSRLTVRNQTDRRREPT